MRRILVLLIGVWLLCTTAARAHEFWIEPASKSRTCIAVPTPVRLMVGDHFAGEPRARRADRIVRFQSIGPGSDSRAVAIPGEEGAEPAGLVELKPGTHTLVYESTATLITLEAVQFTEYLKHSGLDQIIADRAARGESGTPGREAYSRCAKSVVHADGSGTLAPYTDGWSSVAGMPLEIVPLSNPVGLAGTPGSELRVRVLRNGKPLSGFQMLWMRDSDAQSVRYTKTNDSGEAVLSIDGRGFWLISGVHMERAGGNPESDWRSWWASLTFRCDGENR